MPPADTPESNPAYITPAEKLARAVLMFHRGGAWTDDDKKVWLHLTGSSDATSWTLCERARSVRLQEERADLYPPPLRPGSERLMDDERQVVLAGLLDQYVRHCQLERSLDWQARTDLLVKVVRKLNGVDVVLIAHRLAAQRDAEDAPPRWCAALRRAMSRQDIGGLILDLDRLARDMFHELAQPAGDPPG